jgi:hypothetical protein
MVPDYDLPEARRIRGIREVVQLQFDLVCFYRLAREQSRHWEQRVTLDRLFEAKMKDLLELEAQFHTHLEQALADFSLEDQTRLSQRFFRGICLSENSGVTELYRATLETESRALEGIRKAETHSATDFDQQICSQLAESIERDIDILQSELGLGVSAAPQTVA